jgi:predicted Zn-dependent peptidase
VAQDSDQRYAAYLLNTALGGGMSSRLFQEIRENRGHAYSVFSFLSSFRDAGYLGVYVGTAAEWVEEVMTVIAGELRAVAGDGLRPDELARAKNQLKGSMLLGLETSDSRMTRIAKNEVYFQRDFPLAEVAARIDATRNDEIVALAERLVRPEHMAVALLGDLGGRRVDESILAA